MSFQLLYLNYFIIFTGFNLLPKFTLMVKEMLTKAKRGGFNYYSHSYDLSVMSITIMKFNSNSQLFTFYHQLN